MLNQHFFNSSFLMLFHLKFQTLIYQKMQHFPADFLKVSELKSGIYVGSYLGLKIKSTFELSFIPSYMHKII